jgi:hypothetical protein
MPWRQSAYLQYYYLSKWKSLLFATVVLAVALGIFWVTYSFLADPHWSPRWEDLRPRRRKGALIALVIFIFCSLPFWLRTPPAIYLIAEFCVVAIVRIIWAFDKRPDFAIGPHGIYGMKFSAYYHLPWHQILYVQDGRVRVPISNQWFTYGHMTLPRTIVFEGRTLSKKTRYQGASKNIYPPWLGSWGSFG